MVIIVKENGIREMKKGIIYILSLALIALAAGCAYIQEYPAAGSSETALSGETTPPSEALYHFLSARIKMREGDVDEAIAEYQKAISLDNQSPLLYVDIAALYLNTNRTNEAMAACRDALTLDPDYLPAHYLLGGVYSAAGKYREAVSEYERVLTIDPDHLQAYL